MGAGAPRDLSLLIPLPILHLRALRIPPSGSHRQRPPPGSGGGFCRDHPAHSSRLCCWGKGHSCQQSLSKPQGPHPPPALHPPPCTPGSWDLPRPLRGPPALSPRRGLATLPLRKPSRSLSPKDCLTFSACAFPRPPERSQSYMS